MGKVMTVSLLMFILQSTASLAQERFLVFGDMPYNMIDEHLLSPRGKLYQSARQSAHDFVVHVGDIKAGAVPCTDVTLKRNYELVSQLSNKPFVYTPGDNDWTDCDRTTLTPRFDELERLAFVREHFSVQTPALEGFARQAQQSENQRWQSGGVTYLTLHVVGTNNARAQILLSDKKTALEAVQARDKNNMLWLDEQVATEPEAMVIFMQADIYQKTTYASACTEREGSKCNGFSAYIKRLDELATQASFPILLVHGDTGAYCFSQRSSSLWQLNAPGDFSVIDIAQVEVSSGNTPFSVSSLLGSPVASCH